ncbi:MAG: T9SS type A sorting domain-containing protein, partial [Bacteroidia bacterium]
MTSVVAQSVLEQAQGKRFERWVIIPEQAMQRKSNEQSSLPQPLEISVQQSQSMALYPNPANNSVTLEYLFKAQGIVEVYDMLGKAIHKQNIEQNSSINTF